MICKISCSFGEVIDKISILKIKLKKSYEIESIGQIDNIQNELTILETEIPMTKQEDELFDELSKINNKLWILEDTIRDKSSKNEFDYEYINIAELIHKTNDDRFRVKKEINLKYCSKIIEEKLYCSNNEPVVLLEKGKQLFSNNELIGSLHILEGLMSKYKDYEIYDSFYIDLLFSYSNITSAHGIKNLYQDKLDICMNHLGNVPENQKIFCEKLYAIRCLDNLEYEKAHLYVENLHPVNGPGISPNTMSFFSEGDKDKVLVLYDGGGIGDEIMLSRFIPIVCSRFSDNKIIFISKDKTLWMFKQIFENIENIFIYPHSEYNRALERFDYHCSLLKLLGYLNIRYNDIKFTPLLVNLKTNLREYVVKIIDLIKQSKKPTYFLNWKGKSNLPNGVDRRMVNLKEMTPLFRMKNINWVVVTKNITHDECSLLLLHNNVKYIREIDLGENCFEDTIDILRCVKAVVTTDTALAHISLNLKIPTYILLTKGSEWRWKSNDDKNTKWYPDSMIFKQKEISKWDSVINEIKNKF